MATWRWLWLWRRLLVMVSTLDIYRYTSIMDSLVDVFMMVGRRLVNNVVIVDYISSIIKVVIVTGNIIKTSGIGVFTGRNIVIRRKPILSTSCMLWVENIYGSYILIESVVTVIIVITVVIVIFFVARFK